MRLPRPRRMPSAEVILPIVIVISAVALATSEFLTAFEFTPPGGEALDEVSGSDRHGYANVLLAIAAIGALAFASLFSSRPACFALAGIAAIALLVFLVVDLPDVGQRGTLRDPIRNLATAEAVPQAGFWLQAISAIGLAIAAGLYASLAPPAEFAPDQRAQSGAGLPHDQAAGEEDPADDPLGSAPPSRRSPIADGPPPSQRRDAERVDPPTERLGWSGPPGRRR